MKKRNWDQTKQKRNLEENKNMQKALGNFFENEISSKRKGMHKREAMKKKYSGNMIAEKI